MPSALETLVKILKLEQSTGYKDTAVIGGLKSFATNWEADAHRQAKIPEHHQLIDELVRLMHSYGQAEQVDRRHETVKYMLGRITGRIPAPPDLPPSAYAATPPPTPGDASAHASSDERQTETPVTEFIAPAGQDMPTARSEENIGSNLPVDIEPDDTVEADAAYVEDDFAAAESFDNEIVEDSEYPDEAVEDSPPEYSAPQAPPPARATVRHRHRKRQPLSLEEAEARLRELNQPVTVLHKVGDKMAEKLNHLGIFTIEDMLFNLPRRYDDYTRLRTLNKVRPNETVTVVAEVRSVARQQGRGGRPYLLVMVDDDTAVLQVVFFGQMWLQRQFKRGSQIVLSGKTEMFRGQLMMINPEWEPVEREHIHTQRIVPVYPLTKGLSARTMRRLTHQVIDEWGERIPDYMPASVLERTELPELGWALEQAHFPDSFEALDLAKARLSFDELFLFQMAMLGQRREWQSVPGQPIQVDDDWMDAFIQSLPYPLTGAQQRALNDIRADIARDVPMNRLLQGDVGSGKTGVAAAALAMAVRSGKQAAIMAPTSILAEQHMRSISRLLTQSPGGDQIHIRLLTGNTSPAERDEIYRGLAEGWVHVVIGTHALIQGGVSFHNLGLAVIDEQHRFGVEQRGALRGKGHNPHILIMTATPIPRTLALTLYADLDLSIIDEMPPGRMPVETRVLTPIERERAYSFIISQIEKGRQAFVIYPLVESSEKMEEVGAAVDEFERLRDTVFFRQRVGLVHGRMSPAEKEAVMASFAAGELDILVATSVIEVGIDIPNATTILIENANRFGLAQLHQFRGRVGRGEHPSYCLLLAESASEEANKRLQAMEETTDGFRLAEIDWKLRGAGDLLGLRQSGMSQFRLADSMNPRQVELAQREARTVYAEDPTLQQPEHALLARRIRAQQSRYADIS